MGGADSMPDRLATTEAEILALLREAAKRRGLTYLEIDDRAGLANGHFSKIMGESNSPTLHTLAKLCPVLGIGFAEIFGADANPCVDGRGTS